MDDVILILETMKDVVSGACRELREQDSELRRQCRHSEFVQREMKTQADRMIEGLIVNGLSRFGLPMLSEEAGEIGSIRGAKRRIVIDPLDGTVNFVRGLGPASVSVAVCDDVSPICGVIGTYPDCDLAWGGKFLGAFLNDVPLQVSTIADPGQAVLCTGFPARFPIHEREKAEEFVQAVGRYAKVRMLGAASISLLQVAKGSAEVYVENDIMLWDVAAGLAIVEGAEGHTEIRQGTMEETLNVVASNGVVDTPPCP